MNKTIETLWEFVRGDLSNEDFEGWVYTDKNLEQMMGKEDYLEFISIDYRAKDGIHETKLKAADFLSNLPSDCSCLSRPNINTVCMSLAEESFKTLETTKEAEEPYWWLSLHKCKMCGQNWLVANEQNWFDSDCFIRITPNEAAHIIKTGTWPKALRIYEELYPIIQMARVSTYVDNGLEQ